ncbi:MAG: hypothetical protein ACP5H3_03985 [Candidatus Aenigmatarchaeota archaeon]
MKNEKANKILDMIYLGEREADSYGYEVLYKGKVIDIFYPLDYIESRKLKLSKKEIEAIEDGDVDTTNYLFEIWKEEPNIKEILLEEASEVND